jgi:hypothetical protein
MLHRNITGNMFIVAEGWRVRSPMKQRLVRLDRIAGELNAWLLAIAIGRYARPDGARREVPAAPAEAAGCRQQRCRGTCATPSSQTSDSRVDPAFAEGAAMHAVVGPIVTRRGYAFDSWTPDRG